MIAENLHKRSKLKGLEGARKFKLGVFMYFFWFAFAHNPIFFELNELCIDIDFGSDHVVDALGEFDSFGVVFVNNNNDFEDLAGVSGIRAHPTANALKNILL